MLPTKGFTQPIERDGKTLGIDPHALQKSLFATELVKALCQQQFKLLDLASCHLAAVFLSHLLRARGEKGAAAFVFLFGNLLVQPLPLLPDLDFALFNLLALRL